MKKVSSLSYDFIIIIIIIIIIVQNYLFINGAKVLRKLVTASS